MKLRILGWEYKNIRKIENLKIVLSAEKEIHFFMMSNGTGKTTTVALMRAIFDRSAENWDETIIKGYAPRNRDVADGFFSLDFMLDGRKYTIKLLFDYKEFKASYHTISTAHVGGGLEDGWQLNSLHKSIFTPQFVSRFIFDGEQAKKTMSNEAKEAEDAIYYLYRLNIFDEIIGKANTYLEQIKEKGAKGDSDQGFKKMKTSCDKKEIQLNDLKLKKTQLEQDIKFFEERVKNNKEKVQEKLAGHTVLNTEKATHEKKKIEIEQQILSTTGEIKRILRMTQSVTPGFHEIMSNLAKNMQALKLPRSVSKDFFNSLALSPKCICGRDIGKEESKKILEKAEDYLGEEELIALNAIKDKLGSNESRDFPLQAAVDRLRDLNDERDKVAALIARIEAKLLDAGDDEVRQIQAIINQDEIDKQNKQTEYEILTCKTNFNHLHNEINNIKLAEEKLNEAQTSYDKATKTVKARKRVEKLKQYCREIERLTLEKLKEEIIKDTNNRIKDIIKTDDIRIISIKNNIILDRASGSEGQSLDIAYAFIGTLFEKSSFQFPFIIDSPAGKIDFTVRKEIAKCLPEFFKQLIVFVISPEVKDFADAFYLNEKAEFSTIISKEELCQMGFEADKASCKAGKDFFDRFQQTIKEAE